MPHIKMHPVRTLATVSVALTAIAGCANPPPPIADLTQAGTLISQAQDNGAPRYDSTDLAAAQDKLQRANANSRSNPAMAAQLAQEASADAQLALARTRAQKQQDSLTQVNDSLAALHRQVGESETRTQPEGTQPEGTQPGGLQP